MPTLRLPRAEDLSPEDRATLERVAKRRGTTIEGLGEIWKAQAHWPALLEANVNESAQAFMQIGRLSMLAKQAMHVGVSMANACDYWLSTHVVAVLRLGVHERGITEIVGIAEHVVSISAAADGLRLPSDVPARGGSGRARALVTLPDTPTDETRVMWDEITDWSASALGLDEVPAFWRAMSRRPRLLAAIWAKHRLVLSAGELPIGAKLAVALAVAMDKHSDYWTPYFAEAGRRMAAFDDDVIVEIAAATLHYNSFNTIAHGMMLEPPYRDVRASEVTTDDRP